MRDKKSQLSYEYILLIGMVFVLILPFFYSYITSANNRIQLTSEGVWALAGAVHTVYNLGPASRITVTFQTAADSFSVSGTSISAKVKSSDIEANAGYNLVAAENTLKDFQISGQHSVGIVAVGDRKNIYGIAVGPALVCAVQSGLVPEDCHTGFSVVDVSEDILLYGNFNLGDVPIVDGSTLPSTQYTISEDRMILTIKEKTLGTGSHTVTVDHVVAGKSPERIVQMKPPGKGADK